MIPAVVLAAGRSTRMGEPKALLPIAPGGPTFVRQIATVLLDGGAAGVFVVGREDDEALQREVQALDIAVRYVVNANAERGQLSSLIAGLNAADRPGIAGLLVSPVDAPLVRAETVRRLVAAFESGGAAIVRAVYRGRHGHPVIFGRAVFDDVRHADPTVGAKAVLRAHAADVLDLDVDDPGVVDDIDRPEDYARATRPPGSGGSRE
jgi:molybdenum cofactor cytidylyltransferase